MQLIGMLDSPYVRRAAISLRMLDISFEHRSISVFSTFEQFKQINPVVKAPTLVCEDGEVLMDSSLIIEYAEFLAGPLKSLMPAGLAQRRDALQIIGLALAACEKTVQIVYERTLRPAEKQHEPWINRVEGQLLCAYSLLERELSRKPLVQEGGKLNQAGVTTAVAWRFTQMMLPEIVQAADHPVLQDFSAYAEQLPDFVALPPI